MTTGVPKLNPVIISGNGKEFDNQLNADYTS